MAARRKSTPRGMRTPAPARRARGASTRPAASREDGRHTLDELSERNTELLEAASRYATLFEHAPVGLAILTGAGVVLQINDEAAKLIGAPRQRILAKPLIVCVARPDIKLFLNHLLRCGTGAATTALTLRRRAQLPQDRDAALVQLISRRVLLPGAATPVLLTVIVDIRAHRGAEEALRLSEQRYRDIVETADEGICIVDSQNTIVFANRRLASMIGTSVDDLKGRSAYELMPDDDMPRARARFEFHELDENAADRRLRRLDGSTLWTTVSTTRRYDERGHFTGMIYMYIDATARQELAEARERVVRDLVAAQERERQRIALELHDQMGQHIVALSLGLNRLSAACQVSPDTAAVLAELKQTVDVLGREAHTLALELRPSALDHLGLGVTITSYAERLSARAALDIDVHCRGVDELDLGPAVRTGVYRVAQEALTNVAKHAGAKHVSVILEYRNHALQLIVEDDGKGFELRTNAAASPQRLGLAGMHERAALLGGSLTVESRRGQGTTVYLRIPAASLRMEDNYETAAPVAGR